MNEQNVHLDCNIHINKYVPVYECKKYYYNKICIMKYDFNAPHKKFP